MKPQEEAVMANAVIAVFDEYDEAQGAANELMSAGFDQKEIRLSGDGAAAEQATAMQTEKPKKKGIGGFFKSLLGKEEANDDARMYDEAIRHGNFVVTAIAINDERSQLATEVMNHHHPVDLDERSSQWEGQGQQQTAPRPESKTAAMPSASEGAQTGTIPVIQEELKVGKRQVQRGGVRVFQKISEMPIEEEVRLREEHVVVERTPVNKPASEADLAGFKEGSTELRETAEEAVASKSARVVEEVRVGKEATERTERISDKVRRTDVEVERLDDDAYRTHFGQNYANSTDRYEDYEPTYRYGSTASEDARFKGRAWTDAEPEIRRDWESKNPGSKWERFKESIRHAFERVRK
jgi:uncharacterized protein (TIGR02271 family)